MQELKATTRLELGRKVKGIRKAGLMPAVVYGEGVATQSLSISSKDFEKLYKAAGETTLVKLTVEGDSKKSSEYNVLIHDITKHPLKGHAVHADFYAVRMDKIIKAKVPVEFLGESPAVKNEGGILVKVMQELEIEALPKDLPHSIQVDITGLTNIDSRLFVKNIVLPQGVKLTLGAEEVIALVEPPRSEDELATLKEAPIAESMIEIKTEREVKKEVKDKLAAEAEQTEGEK